MNDIKECCKNRWIVNGLEERLAIIIQHESDATKTSIDTEPVIGKRTKNLEQSTISPSNFHTTRTESTAMIEMERNLLIGIEDCNQKRISLCQKIIQIMAVSLLAEIPVQRKRREENET